MAHGRLGAVAEDLEAALAASESPAGYTELLRLAVACDGKVLSAAPTSRWPLLVLAACETVSDGEWQRGVSGAAGIEAFVAALDLLDDLQDGDRHPVIDRCGVAQAMNVSTGLLLLAQRCLLRSVHRGVAPDAVLRASEDLAKLALTIGGGQYLDLLYESRDGATEDEALDVASRKSGTLVACACRVGAHLGGADAGTVELLGRFGWHAGLAAQLLNDCRDASPGGPLKSDIRRGKKSLPLVVAARFGAGNVAGHHDEEALRRSLASSGALMYTWLVADQHCQAARRVLAEIGSTSEAIGTLSRLLPHA